jgi:3-methylcrotonyl-CoA carboxylase alpha subunit
MGLKDAAKRLMAEAGVPVVPGYHGADQDPGHLEVEAARIGYPVLIKARGGRRRQGDAAGRAPGGLPDGAGQRGARQRRFGNDAVLIEKYVEKPRHIEVQVFGDGTARRASVRARLLAPAPPPEGDRGGARARHDEEMRAAMGAAAVRAAEAIGYSGAGTVEFIADGSRGLRPTGSGSWR